MDHTKRLMAAMARIRTAVANLVSGGEVEKAKAATAEAESKLAASEREKDEMVAAVESLADELDPPAPAVDPKAADPKAADPKAADPKAGDPKAADPTAGQQQG